VLKDELDEGVAGDARGVRCPPGHARGQRALADTGRPVDQDDELIHDQERR